MRLWPRKHRCPPSVSLKVLINGQLVVGPITAEQLAYVIKYGGHHETMDLLNPEHTAFHGDIHHVQILVTRI